MYLLQEKHVRLWNISAITFFPFANRELPPPPPPPPPVRSTSPSSSRSEILIKPISVNDSRRSIKDPRHAHESIEQICLGGCCATLSPTPNPLPRPSAVEWSDIPPPPPPDLACRLDQHMRRRCQLPLPYSIPETSCAAIVSALCWLSCPGLYGSVLEEQCRMVMPRRSASPGHRLMPCTGQ